MQVHREVSLFVYITDLIFFLCLVARLVLSEPQLRVEVEYTWFMGYHQVTVMMMTTLGMIFPAVMFPVLQVRWEQNHISSVIIIIHSGGLSGASCLAAQSALLSMQAESSLVDVAPASLIRVPINKDTGQPRPRCPCVARHRTSWLAGNSQWSPQWPVRPSLLNPILSDKGGRSPYCSALATRPRQLALRTRLKNVGLNFGPVSKPRKSFWWISKSRVRVTFASRSLEFFFSVFFADGFRSLGFVVFSFRLVFRSRIFESSREFTPIQLIELS